MVNRPNIGAWSAGAMHLKGREQWIGWNDEQRHRRLPLVVNNARLLGLPGWQVPNLMSRFMKGMLSRLNADWQERWGHPVAVVETFVDPALYRGTCYKVSGWTLVRPRHLQGANRMEKLEKISPSGLVPFHAFAGQDDEFGQWC
jgi:hypothetical protein